MAPRPGLLLLKISILFPTSGTTATWVHHAPSHGDRKGLINGLWLRILLGATFTCVQAYEYHHAAFTVSGHIYGATFSTVTDFDGADAPDRHRVPDRASIRADRGHFTPTQHLGFESLLEPGLRRRGRAVLLACIDAREGRHAAAS